MTITHAKLRQICILKFKNTALTIALTLVMAIVALPGISQQANAASAEETWSADQTIESNKTIEGGVDIESSVNLTVKEGVTLTVKNGIILKNGSTLTVSGNGTLIVTGLDGADGSKAESSGWGGDGGNGESAIIGDIIVEGATVKVTGGKGGAGGEAWNGPGGDAGDGGCGINGSLIVNRGNVTVTGGNGGNGGLSYQYTPGDGGNGGCGIANGITVNGGLTTLSGGNGGIGGDQIIGDNPGENGTCGKGVGGNITVTEDIIAAESENNETWTEISDNVSDKQYIMFSPTPKTVLVDIGKGHEAMFTEEVLSDLASYAKAESATIDGNVITLESVDPYETEYSLLTSVTSYAFTYLLESPDYKDSGEALMGAGFKSIDNYTTNDEYASDTYNDERMETLVSNNLKCYYFWQKPLKKLELGSGNPTCGKDAKAVKPTVPDGMIIEDTEWRDAVGIVQKYEGGKEYTCNMHMKLNNDGALWKYFIDPENITVSVKGGNDVKILDGEVFGVSFKTTADHDWDAGKITRSGIKTYTCKSCGKTKNESAPETVKTVTVNAKTVSAAAVNAAVKKAGGSNKYVTKIILGKKVRKISKGAFKKYRKLKTLEIKTKKLKKATVKKSLTGSKITKIKVKVGKKKTNKSYVKKYKKIFTKKNAGKKVKISA